ncbi:DUF3082 domain-containing protein [Leptolyngbya cf. ectocarpi LEGE 11479]|uniref:DUF3082 domain-containing protein n=1 Tax=Leptolyngbya cf. ectocarpi LEGE 11479 TaxID=1828722 RepID=A0A928ZSV5_LEPEC|nr:DUF3082 domain-containing protein [Leptolyngbya ectocarpi]MBE9066897.1 DUF3082 domain-containing protein [Leptolyngbya cf. ectocarpi LEGE 11479]
MAEPPNASSSKPSSSSAPKAGAAGKKSVTPLSCFTGATMAGVLGMLCYRMMVAIATTFAAKPVVSDNTVVLNISVAVRTLVVGIVALGAGVFGITAVGLFLLGIQTLIKKFTNQTVETP